MIIVGDPDQCFAEDSAVRGARRRPADLLRAVRLPAARVGHAHHRAARQGGHPRARAGRDQVRSVDDGRRPERPTLSSIGRLDDEHRRHPGPRLPGPAPPRRPRLRRRRRRPGDRPPDHPRAGSAGREVFCIDNRGGPRQGDRRRGRRRPVVGRRDASASDVEAAVAAARRSSAASTASSTSSAWPSTSTRSRRPTRTGTGRSTWCCATPSCSRRRAAKAMTEDGGGVMVFVASV